MSFSPKLGIKYFSDARLSSDERLINVGAILGFKIWKLLQVELVVLIM